MGLTENFNSDLTPKTSNNIDVHMMLSTEYGAIAILSASAYGNPNNVTDIKTTSGNNTGVILKKDADECVAAGSNDYKGNTPIFSGVAARYYNIYTNNRTSAKAGDALGTNSIINPGCANWHGTNGGNWIVSQQYNNTPYMLRRNRFEASGLGTSNAETSYSRGVAVCGQGF